MTNVAQDRSTAVCTVLTAARWDRCPDLVVKGQADRPVFVMNGKRCEYKVVVGPLWTTYYKLERDTITHQDSVKTDDIEALKVALSKLLKA